MISTMYREYPPPQALAGFVECLWRHQLSEDSSWDGGVILPDGRVDVVWTGGGQTLVAGPQTRSVPRPLRAPFVAIGARFHPGVGPPLLGLPAHELVDMHVSLDAIDTRAASLLGDLLARIEAPGGARGRLDSALAVLAAGAEPADPQVVGAARMLDESRSSVGRVAMEVALSERQLQRRFRDAVGYGPKTLQRILRFQRFLRELGQNLGSAGLAGIAASTGYADQAHLTREARQLSGLSPVQLEQLWGRRPFPAPLAPGARSPRGS